MADFRPLADLYPNEASLKNNNPAGISYFGDNSFTKSLTEKGIKWSPGTKRPSAEGAQYLSFDTAEDGMKAYDALWSTKKYQSMKVQDALNRWGTGKIGANIDTNKTVSQLTPEERNQLQVAQLAKESPGFLKEMKKAGLLKESEKKKGLLERAFNLFVPSAEASSPEVNYSFNMNGTQDSYKPVNAGSVTPAIKEPNFDDVNSVKSFFLENGGFGAREAAAADVAVAKLGMTKEEAVKAVARRKYAMITASSTPEGKYSQMVNKFRSEGLVGGYDAPATPEQEAVSQKGILGVAPQVNDEEVQRLKSEWSAMPNEQFISMMNQENLDMKVSEAQKASLVQFLKDEYANALASGNKEAMSDIEGTTQKVMPRLYKDSFDATKARGEVLGQAGGAEGALQSTMNTWEFLKNVPVFGQVLKTVQRGATGVENVGEGISEGNFWQAAKGGLDTISNAAMMAPGSQIVKNAIAQGLDSISKTEIGGKFLGAIASAPEPFFRAIAEARGMSEEEIPYFVAAGRDAILQAAIPAAAGGLKGAKAGLQASPAATSASKVGSALTKGALGAGVEGLKGVFNPFQSLESVRGKVTDIKLSPKSTKVIDDAAKRLDTAKKNMDKMVGVKDRFEKADFIDAAEGYSKVKKLSGMDIKTADDLENAVASAKESVFKEMDTAAKGKPVNFEIAQLENGIASMLESKLGRKLDDATRSTVNDAVSQIKKNLTAAGKVVANMDSVHKVASKLYDVIIGSSKERGIMSVNAPEAYLAAKEVLYGQLSKIPEFSKYLDDYRNLSRMEDISKLMKAKFGSDVKNKTMSEIVPASWTGIMAGSVGAQNWGIAGSALMASLLSYKSQLKKSPTNLFNDIKKVSEALEAAGEGAGDSLRSKMGVVKKEQLGKNSPDISNDLLGLARTESSAPSASVSKPTGRSVDLSGFDVGTPVSTPRSPSAPVSGPMFGQPGFAESLGINSATKAPAAPAPKATSKKPVQSPEEIAKLKAEIAAENAKASVPAKKAPAKKSAPKPAEAPKKAPAAPKATKSTEKPKAAPKAKETEKPMKITAKAAETIRNVAKQAVDLSTKERLALVRSFDKIDLQRIAQVLKGTKSGFLADVLAELNSK